MSSSKDMLDRLDPRVIGCSFAYQYYNVLAKGAEHMYKFYRDYSWLGWSGLDGEETGVVSTISRIEERIMSSDFRNSLVEINNVAAQRSHDGGLIVPVTGLSEGKDNAKRNFHQTFFLATQDDGYFVLNDILQFSSVCESVTSSSTHDDDQQDRAASSVPNADTQALNMEAEVKDENVKGAKEEVDLSVADAKDIDTEILIVPSPVPDAEVEVPEGYDVSMADWVLV